MKGPLALTAHRDSLQDANQYLTELLKPCYGPCNSNESSTCYTCQKRDIDEDYLRKMLKSLRAAFPVLMECLTTDVDCLEQRRETEALPLESRLLHNTGSSMNLLPKEIFTAIITCVIQDLLPSEYSRALEKMRMVCVGWNKWIEATPDLWSVVDVNSWTRTTIQQHLARAESAALSVHHRMYARTLIGREKFREVTMPTLSRCRTLNLHLPPDLFPDLAATPAPALRTARLSFFATHSTRGMPHPIDLFASDAPLLESISIFEVPVRWGSPIFAGLRCLQIGGILGDPPVTHLVDTLLHCPQLSRLDIVHCDIEDDRVASGQGFPIPLPQLEDLHFQLFTAEVLVYILENIEALPTRGITIKTNQITDEHLARRLQSAGRTLLARAKDSLRVLERVEITAPTERGDVVEAVSYGKAGQEFVLNLQFEGPTSVSWTSWFCQDILPSLPGSVKLSVDLGDRTHTAVLSDFGPVPQVETVKVSARHGSMAFVELMSVPIRIPNADGVAQKNCWPFPGLRELHVLGGTVDATKFLKMLESRYGLPGPAGATDIANGIQAAAAPALKTIGLPYMEKIVIGNSNYSVPECMLFRKINRILGKGVLQFATSRVGV